jgi:hypothetical protein
LRFWQANLAFHRSKVADCRKVGVAVVKSGVIPVQAATIACVAD